MPALRRALRREDAEWLIGRYLDFEKRHSPKDLDGAEFAALLAEVKKKPPGHLWTISVSPR